MLNNMKNYVLQVLSLSVMIMIVNCSPECFQPFTGDVIKESGQLVTLNVSLTGLLSAQADSLVIRQAHFVEGSCGYHVYLNIDNTYIYYKMKFTCEWTLRSTKSSPMIVTFASYGYKAFPYPFITEAISHSLPTSFRGIIFHTYFSNLVAEGVIEGHCEVVDNPTSSVIMSMEINGCPSGSYGVSCSQYCSCAVGIQCHSFNGVCMCPKGLVGSRCDVVDPYVEVDSKHIYAKWGFNLELVCTAHGIGIPGVLISWERDGITLSTNYTRDQSIDYSPRPLLIVHVISNMTDALNGEYRCVVDEGLVQRVNITAIGLPEPFLDPPLNQTVRNGENVTLKCQVRENTGTVKWTRGSQDLNNVTEIQITNKTDIAFDENSRVSTLTIIMVELSDELSYRCYVGHTFGTGDVNFIEAYVTVVIPPVDDYPVIEGINDANVLSVREGDLISIACAVYDVKPQPKLTWTLEGNNIDEMHQTSTVLKQGGIYTVKRLLTLPAHSDDNFKDIACLAEDDLIGYGNQSINLNISYAPKIYIESDSIDISEGDMLTATCLGSSNPPPTYRWECLQPDSDVIYQDGHVFSMVDVSSDLDQSRLRCIASNSIGTSYAVKVISIRGSGIPLEIMLPVSAFILLSLMLVIPAIVYIRKKKTTIPHVIPTQNKEFDVFISYKGDTEEETFVIRTLVPKLEESGYRVCVHYKHFIAGKTIIENIISSVSKSHMTMIVLSRAFVESEWCKFEFHSASTEMPNFENNVIPVMFDDVTQLPNLDKTLQDLLKRVNYITWPRDCENDDSREKHFWKLVKKALRPIVNPETIL